MKVKELIAKLQEINPEHEVYVMDQPDSGDTQHAVDSCYEWDGCCVVGITIEDDE